jgi:hypothetical protein
MAHCFDIHKSDRPYPHAHPEKQKHVLCVIITVFKIRIKKTPHYLHDKINYVKERQQYNLRNCEDFDLKLCKFNP